MAITYTTNLDLKLNRITNVGAPADSSDAVTKQYVDNVATGLVWKDAVRVGALTNVSLSSPGASIDGVTLTAGNRVLLMGQSNAVENGLYTYDGTTLVRTTDADANSELRPGTAVTVAEGTKSGNHTFVLTTDGPITIGTTELAWSLLNAGTAPVYTGSYGVDITDNKATAVAALHGGLAVGPTGIAVVTDPDGGLQVTNNGVATKLVPNTALKADNNGLQFVPRPDFGLDVDSGGAGVKIKANTGLTVDALGVQTVLMPDKGLKTDVNGFQVVSGNGIATDSTGVKVVADNAGGLTVGSAGVAVRPVLPASGLQADINGLTVVAQPTGGLQVANDGVGIKPKPANGLATDNTGARVVLRPDDGLDVDADGIGIKTDSVGGLQTSPTGLGIDLGTTPGLTLDNTGVSVLLDGTGGLGVDNFGVKVKPNPAVTNVPANPASIIVGTDGISVNTAMVARRYATSVGDNASTSIAVTHNLNTLDVQVELYSNAAPHETVYAEVQRTDLNTVTLIFGSGSGSAPTSGQYRCVVVG